MIDPQNWFNEYNVFGLLNRMRPRTSSGARETGTHQRCGCHSKN